jgi:ABC-type nitrate/sulfonate/bicarbonate transport system substrate-binding protein
MIRKTRLALLAAVGFIFVIAVFLWQAGFLSRRAPLEKVTVGSIAARISGPLYIAQSRGYFTAQGLEVTIRDNAGSPESISDLEAGRLDLACCGAFNLMKEALAGAGNSRGLAILCNGQIMDLVARRDRGIDRLEDLRGKTVGLLRGTAAEYFLGRVCHSERSEESSLGNRARSFTSFRMTGNKGMTRKRMTPKNGFRQPARYLGWAFLQPRWT